jgi:hypothetical protein
MGHPDDPYAVVDSDFRVFGVDGLRIVDASVWPVPPGYYPTIPTMRLSEKAADVMLGQSPPPVEDFDTDALGPLGSLGFGLVGSVTGLADPNVGADGVLGQFGSLLGGSLFGNLFVRAFGSKSPPHGNGNANMSSRMASPTTRASIGVKPTTQVNTGLSSYGRPALQTRRRVSWGGEAEKGNREKRMSSSARLPSHQPSLVLTTCCISFPSVMHFISAGT